MTNKENKKEKRYFSLSEYFKLFECEYIFVDDEFVEIDKLESNFKDAEKEDLPTYAYGAEPFCILLCADDIIERFEESTYIEDYEMSEMASNEIRSFCEKWNDNHSEAAFDCNKSIVIRLTPEDFGRS